MNVGIYMWISPSGRIYVGQSKNLSQRKEWYISGGIYKAKMPKLKKSFKKYGIENHVFKVIEECFVEQLNEREIYWGLYYDTLNTGLNCKLGEQNCIFSNETKQKMSLSKKNQPQNDTHKQKRLSKLKPIWENKRMVAQNKTHLKPKYTPTREHRNNLSKSKKGKSIHTPQSKQKLSEIGKTRDMSKVYSASAQSRQIPVLQYDIYGNFIKEYPSANSAEMELNGKKGDNIRSCIRGKQKTAYGFIWKEKQ